MCLWVDRRWYGRMCSVHLYCASLHNEYIFEKVRRWRQEAQRLWSLSGCIWIMSAWIDCMIRMISTRGKTTCSYPNWENSCSSLIGQIEHIWTMTQQRQSSGIWLAKTNENSDTVLRLHHPFNKTVCLFLFTTSLFTTNNLIIQAAPWKVKKNLLVLKCWQWS